MHYPAQPGTKAPGPSTLAAWSAGRNCRKLRDDVLAALAAQSMTADECAAKLQVSILSIRPRFSELRAMGRIAETETRRPSSTGHSSTVWRAL